MKRPVVAFLLLLQCLTATVLALPPARPIEERSPARGPEECTPDQYRSVASLGQCTPKRKAGRRCKDGFECKSGHCDIIYELPTKPYTSKFKSSSARLLTEIHSGKCAEACSDQSQCPKGWTCRDSACHRGDQALNAKCDTDDDCHSKNCINQKCQPPNAKLIGETCEDKDYCQLGAMCWKGTCSTRGFNYEDGTLGGSCYDVKHNIQCLETTYCDPNLGYTCQPKKGKGSTCGNKNVLDGLLAGSQCVSGRCVEGICAPSHVGTPGEPCSQNEKVCVGKFECQDSLYKGANGPAKICNWPDNPDVGNPCKQAADCPGPDTRCYRGGDSTITGTCQRTYTIGGKSCKVEEECGGIGRSKVWSNLGAYDGVNGGWGLVKREDGFICSSGKCQDVHREFSDTKKITEDE